MTTSVLTMIKAAVEIFETAHPIVWYADTKYIEYGQVLKLPESPWNPEYYVFNTRQFEEEIRPFYAVRWRHIREYRPDWSKINLKAISEPYRWQP